MTDHSAAFAALGVTQDEIDAATESGTLLALAAERFLLPGERMLNRSEFAERSGVPSE